MKIVYKSNIVDKITDMIKTQIDMRRVPYENVDYISLTEDEAVDLYDYMKPHIVHAPWSVFYRLSREEKIKAVDNAKFFGFYVKVE